MHIIASYPSSWTYMHACSNTITCDYMLLMVVFLVWCRPDIAVFPPLVLQANIGSTSYTVTQLLMERRCLHLDQLYRILASNQIKTLGLYHLVSMADPCTGVLQLLSLTSKIVNDHLFSVPWFSHGGARQAIQTFVCGDNSSYMYVYACIIRSQTAFSAATINKTEKSCLV